MGKKILDSKILYMVISVLLTLGLWCYVSANDGTPQDDVYRNVPVVFDGLDVLTGRELMIVNTNVTTNITIRATPTIHAKLREGAINGDLTVTAKVSGISEEGSHSVAYIVNPPANVSTGDMNLISTTRGNVVTIDVARFLSRRIPLEGVFKGSVAEGYLAGSADDFSFSPSEIVISGRAEYVNQVHHALITLSTENLTETVREEYPFQLIGANGDELKDLNVTCDVDTVYTTFPIRAVAELPLKIVLTPGGGLGENDVSVELSTVDSIIVAGSKDAVAALVSEGGITLGKVDLASIRDGDERTFSVPLEEGLENLSGVSEIKATFTINKQVVSQTFAVTNIQTINEPEGWTVELVTKELPVEIRGTRRLMDELIEENIRVVVDLQNINLAAGQQTVTASIALASSGSKSDIGEMAPAAGSNYTVVIRLAPAEENPPAEEN